MILYFYDYKPLEIYISSKIIANRLKIYYSKHMKEERIHYTTTLKSDLLRKLKYLSIDQNKRQNDLLEEAIQDLLKKYEKNPEK